MGGLCHGKELGLFEAFHMFLSAPDSTPFPYPKEFLLFNTSIGQIVTVSQICFKMLQFIKVILCMCQLVYTSTVERGANRPPKCPKGSQ